MHYKFETPRFPSYKNLPDSCLQWHKLPAAVTALVLQHLPLQGRLAAARDGQKLQPLPPAASSGGQ
jgi:hypothetical protein